jgi:hypothetical protein
MALHVCSASAGVLRFTPGTGSGRLVVLAMPRVLNKKLHGVPTGAVYTRDAGQRAAAVRPAVSPLQIVALAPRTLARFIPDFPCRRLSLRENRLLSISFPLITFRYLSPRLKSYQ